ncbi:MAG: twin-arginine translocase TatA/TatE family subunit [Candidatus Midichloriaceae bacterium]
MFDISLSELLLIFIIGVLVLKPKDLVSIFEKVKRFNRKLMNKEGIEEDFFGLENIDLFNKDGGLQSQKNEKIDEKEKEN